MAYPNEKTNENENENAIETSFRVLRTRFQWKRLFIEEPGIENPCSKFKDPDNPWIEVVLNALRILLTLFVAPLYLLIRPAAHAAGNWISAAWLITAADTPEAVLFNAPGVGDDRYDIASLLPKWAIKLTIRNGTYAVVQIPWTGDVGEYTALSYSMESARQLFDLAGRQLQDPENVNGRKYSLRDRRSIAELMLIEYAVGRPDGVEYVWLDEFCLSDANQQNEKLAEEQRVEEVGRLADIFGAASQVCVFCHLPECSHTDPNCPWGTRIFTLAEILHAKTVLTITIKGNVRGRRQRIEMVGEVFRAKMREQAERSGRWHLYAVMQHSTNTGSVPWQVAIHALVVEIIRRDIAGNFPQHKFVGKALNGLLPRRARLAHLQGTNGWTDLAWLLELNQGFYNAASLAAVCSLEGNGAYGHCWLGTPIEPYAGNERLEPIVNAFPVCIRRPQGDIPAALNVIGPHTVGVGRKLKRDAAGLYHNDEMKGLKWLAAAILSAVTTSGLAVLSKKGLIGALMMYLGTVLYCAVELAVGTMYLVRRGWVFIYVSEWGPDPRIALGKQDSNLQHITGWGPAQLVPRWQQTNGAWPGFLLDLQHRVLVETFVSSPPNAVIPLAVHGNGITCMLLHRPHDPFAVAHRVGMASMPPYLLAQGVKSGSVCVGSFPDMPLHRQSC